jgi:SNF family Na+-dependent transporter
MLHVLIQQLTGKGYSRPVALGVAVAGTGVLTFAATQPTFSIVVQLLALLPLLGLSLFVGWIMKISHVRKALNLPSEGLYNLWRVMVRLVVPGLCLWIMAGVFL